MPRVITGRYFEEALSLYYILGWDGVVYTAGTLPSTTVTPMADFSLIGSPFNITGAKESNSVVLLELPAGGGYAERLYTSTNNGASYSQTRSLGKIDYGWGTRMLLSGATNNVYLANRAQSYPTNTSGSYVEISSDGGNSWAGYLLHTPYRSVTNWYGSVAPRSDNKAYVYNSFRYVSPTENDDYIDLVDNGGNVIDSYNYDPTVVFGTSEGMFAIAVPSGDNNILLGCNGDDGSLWKLEWDTKTWTKNTSFSPTSYQKQIICAPNGNVIINEGYLSLNLSYSEDNGETWSASTIPDVSDIWYFDTAFIMVGASQMAICLNDGSFLYSDDNGITWSRTGQLRVCESNLV